MDQVADRQIQQRVDLAEIASRYRRSAWLIAGTSLAGAVLFGGLTYLIPPRYTAVTEMTYAPQTPPDVRSVGNATPPQALTDTARDAQISAAIAGIGSLPVAVRVVDGLQLQRDLDLVAKAQKYAAGGNMREAVATALLDQVRVRRVGETPLIDINYTARDPLRAARIADAFGKAYEDQQRADNLTQSQDNTSRMDSSAQQLAQQARDADAAVARFKLDHHMVFDPRSPNIGTDIATVTASLADAQAQLAEAQSRARFVAAGGMNDQLAANSPLAPLLGQQAQVSGNLAALQARYGLRHPKVIEAQREYDDIRAQVALETRRQAEDASAQARAAAQRVASLQGSLATVRNLQVDQIAAATQLEGLQRQADTANLLYNNMLANSSQEAAKQAVMPPDTTISTHANPPLQPSFPILPLDIAIGLLLGFSAGLGIAYVRERWSMGLTSNTDIEKLLGQTFLNSLPTLASTIDKPTTRDPVAAILAHPLSLYTEAYRSLATNLRLSRPGVKVIGVTSALPKEGKTTCAINMARTLAMAGDRVLLMDCDLRRRSSTVTLCPEVDRGLIQVIGGSCALEDALYVDATGLNVLPLAPQAHLGHQPFGTPAFAEMMAHLRKTYDVVVIDTAPVLAVVDVRLLLSHIDALGLLARWRVTPIRAIRAALHQIESVGGDVAGVAMSLVDINAQVHAGYGDASHYYSEMKEYYAA